MKAKPVIIVGAPRSGTNMLRDIICKFDSVSTWPCDEINYIWRHGNVMYPSDEIPSDRVTRAVKEYIHRKFDWVSDRYKSKYVVEKTCANSLRVPFVDKIIPDARYIYIVRDGLDVVGSAKLRWTAAVDIPYLVKKVRFVPLVDLPFYSMRYFKSRIYRFFSTEERLGFWGPRLDQMDDVLRSNSLDEICALQWKKCVDESDKAFHDISSDRVITVKYEEFVQNPSEELKRIMSFLNIDAADNEVQDAVSNVSDRSVGKGREALGDSKTQSLSLLINDTMVRHDYRLD